MENNINMYAVGAIVKGIIIEIAPFGAFIECYNGQKGLLHISEISTHYVTDVSDVLKLNQKLTLKVIASDPTNHYLKLSLKQCPQTVRPSYIRQRRVRIKVPKHEINFKQLADTLPEWIAAALTEAKE